MTDVDQRITRDVGELQSLSPTPRQRGVGRGQHTHRRRSRSSRLAPSPLTLSPRSRWRPPPMRAERLSDDLSALIPTLVKPVVDITWFS